jgi:hypothetical protein
VDFTIPSVSVTNSTAKLPQIVYENSWLSQTTAISQTTIFTPSAAGLYRITLGLETVAVATSGSGPLTSAYIDLPSGYGPLVSVGASIPTYTDATDGVVRAFVGTSSGPDVKLRTSIDVSDHLDHYNVYVTIERLK